MHFDPPFSLAKMKIKIKIYGNYLKFSLVIFAVNTRTDT